MTPLVNPAFETLKPYVPGKPVQETERELNITGCIKLASNENPLGPSPMALQAIADYLPQIHEYPDGGAFYLKQALAEKLGIETNRLIVGNGSNEIIEMLIRTCVGPHEHMVYCDGSFVIYKLCAQAAGIDVRHVPMRRMHFDLAAMAEAMDKNTKLVFIANPNNPTGTYVSKPEFEQFLNRVPPHVVVVVDEAYREYVRAPDFPAAMEYLQDRPRMMVLHTFSKCYGLAGLRVGYGVGDPTLIDYLNRGRQPFNVNSVAQIAAMAAMHDTTHIQQSCALNWAEMDALVPALRRIGCDSLPSQANFLLVDFKRDAQEVFAALLRLGVIVRPMGGYGFTTMARLTIGTAEQNQRLLRALTDVLGAPCD